MSAMQTRTARICIIAALLIGSQSACSERSSDASRAAQRNVQSAVSDQNHTRTHAQPTGDQAAPPAGTESTAGSALRLCRFEVDGRVLVAGKCNVFPMGNGGYTLNTWRSGKPRDPHFAVVISEDGKKAEASWNADPDDDRAVDSLGPVLFRSGCWVNHRTKICSR